MAKDAVHTALSPIINITTKDDRMEETPEYGHEPTYIVSPPGHIDPLRADMARSALQGLLANGTWVMVKSKNALKECGNDIEAATAWLKRDIAEDAVEFADAVIEQLKEH